MDKKQMRQVGKFVCDMYGKKKKLYLVNDSRLKIFLKKYELDTKGTMISYVKKMDSGSLLPCSRVIKEKINQTYYIRSIWHNTMIANPPNFQPKNFDSF